MSWARTLDPAALGVRIPPGLPPAVITDASRAGALLARELMVAVWPVATGLSLALWVAQPAGGLLWELSNEADYVEYVHIDPANGGPPGLADRRWVEIQPELRAEMQGAVDQVAAALADKAQRGFARGKVGRARLVRPTTRSQAPTMRRFVDPLEARALAAVPVAVPSGGAVSARAAAVVAESLMQPYIRTGAVDGLALVMIRSGRLLDAEARIRAAGQIAAANRLRQIISQSSRAAA